MSETQKEPEHVFLKDRMAGYKGWFKTLILGVTSIIMLGMLAGNMLQSF